MFLQIRHVLAYFYNICENWDDRMRNKKVLQDVYQLSEDSIQALLCKYTIT